LGRNLAIGCGGLIALIVIAAIATTAANSGSTNSTSVALTASPSPAVTKSQTSTPTPKPTPKPAGPLLDLSGSGLKNSAPFNAPDHWKLAYTYDCTGFGGQGNFQVFLYQGSALVNILVNELGAKGSATTDVYNGGNGMHLEMNSECDWHVTATNA